METNQEGEGSTSQPLPSAVNPTTGIKPNLLNGNNYKDWPTL